MYVGYDYGTWRINDDAWLKAELYAGSNKHGITKAYYRGEARSTVTADSGNNYYAISQIPGVDYFDSGSYASTSNSYGHLYLEVTD